MTKEQPMHRRTLLAAAVPFALAAPAARAQQRFPNRPVTVIVPFTAGGPTDVITRIVAEGMSRDLGQPVVIENVTGAGGTIAAARVAQARPDGHTLLMHHIGHASTATLYRRLPYSVTDSFAPLGLVSDAAMTLVARPDFPAADLAGFMAEIKRQGDGLNLAHSGLGGANHLCGMLLQHAAGTALTGVVFRGSAPAITDLMAGRIHALFGGIPYSAPALNSGKAKVLAVGHPTRTKFYPDVPAVAEILPGFTNTTWYGLLGPARTPQYVVDKINAEMKVALANPEFRKQLEALGLDPVSSTPKELHDRIRSELARWTKVIKEAGIKLR